MNSMALKKHLASAGPGTKTYAWGCLVSGPDTHERNQQYSCERENSATIAGAVNG